MANTLDLDTLKVTKCTYLEGPNNYAKWYRLLQITLTDKDLDDIIDGSIPWPNTLPFTTLTATASTDNAPTTTIATMATTTTATAETLAK